MNRWTKLATAAAAVGALTVLPTTQAQAIWVLPSQAPLTDAAGASNGCVGQIDPFVVDRFGTGMKPPLSASIPMSLTCPHSADAHRESIGLTVFEVMPDGTKMLIIGPGEIARSSSTTPITTAGATSYWQCPDKGEHTLLARASIKTKTSKTDTNPFIAKVHRLQTVSCR